MKILLATSNEGKVKEIKEFYKNYEIFALKDILEPFEIIEDGSSFKQNALIKTRAVFDKLKNKKISNEFLVLSDDSGISVEILGGAPGIYSARYSGENATDATNRAKLIQELKAKNIKRTPAFYTAAIAMKCELGEFCVHGFMHGDVIDEERGDSGFGYDFMFIPKGYDKTIGELPLSLKLEISHRTKALQLNEILLRSLQKQLKFQIR